MSVPSSTTTGERRAAHPLQRVCALLLLTLVGCESAQLCLTCGADEDAAGAQSAMDGGAAGSKDAGTGSPPFPSGGTGGGGDAGTGTGDDGTAGCYAGREEACNGKDDDCDKEVDEGFDLQRDLRHCGNCDATCGALNAEASCSDGTCTLGGCQIGYEDLDGDAGCEYRCPIFPTRDEDCNGTDDDCDGVIDEDLMDPPENLCRVIPGTPCADVKPTCRTRDDRTFWVCSYGDAVEFDPRVANGIVAEESLCDGLDGDCDGEVDEPWDIGEACDDDEHGSCQGLLACDPTDAKQTTCSFDHLNGANPDAEEICNGFDDNCDGLVDNGVIDDLVHVARNGLDFYIYRHEASRPDATASLSGTRTERACGRGGVVPWTFVTYDAAASACAAAGKRLCTAEEWLAACEGTDGDPYPYGQTYGPAACNGADHGPTVEDEASTLLPTGSLNSCQSDPEGIFDLSGNVKEWTSDLQGTTSSGAPIYVVRGGSFESPQLGLTCQTDLSQAAAYPGQAGIGFRCCSNQADGP